MSIRTPEIASAYGAIDSNAFADGSPVDPHILRTLARSANRLVCRGEMICQYIFESSTLTTAGLEQSRLETWGWPLWLQILPGPVIRKKKPGITKATLDVRYAANTGDKFYIQCVTDRSPFNPAADGNSENTIAITAASSAHAWATKTGIPLEYGSTEHTSFWMRGVPGTATAAATYGDPIGNCNGLHRPNIVECVGAAFTTSLPTFASTGHAVEISDGTTGDLLVPASWIAAVVSSERLVISPDIPEFMFVEAHTNFDYRIVALPAPRIINLALYGEDRTE